MKAKVREDLSKTKSFKNYDKVETFQHFFFQKNVNVVVPSLVIQFKIELLEVKMHNMERYLGKFKSTIIALIRGYSHLYDLKNE